MNSRNTCSFITLFGAAGFVGTVVYLQAVQVSYNPVQQLMSELALGEQGQLMLVAFIMFALAVSGSIGIMARFKANKLMSVLLAVASASLLGAGIFELGAATTLHVSLVAVAFVLLGLVMYLVPRHVVPFQNIQGKLANWFFGIGTGLSVLLGNNVLPVGVGQRLAAACILLWLCWLAIFALMRK